MTEKISVLIVDDIPETRENVRKLLQFESDLDVIGHAATGGEAIRIVEEQKPDVVLMDINMPDSDGITASQTITKNVPGTQIIIMSVQSEADYLRRAMLAGARDFLMKPFSGDELVEAVRRIHETRPELPQAIMPSNLDVVSGTALKAKKLGNVITVFSPKGGVGCTTVAVNVASVLAEEGHKTLLIDGSLQFGDVALMLNLKSTMSIIDLIENLSDLDADLVSSVLLEHATNLKVLLAPPRPEMAELATANGVRKLLKTLRTLFDYIIIDTSSALDEVNLSWLDSADRIVLVARQNLPSIKNVSRFFDLSEVLDYEQDKVLLVVNHASKKARIPVKDIEEKLSWSVSIVIPEDEAAHVAADMGEPLVSQAWRRRKRPSTRALVRLSELIRDDLEQEEATIDPAASNGGLARLFSR
jgi:pilus assembly protein CpaE